MQLGNLVVGTGAGLIVALVERDLTVAIGVTLAMVLKLVTERVVRVSITLGVEVDQVPPLAGLHPFGEVEGLPVLVQQREVRRGVPLREPAVTLSAGITPG